MDEENKAIRDMTRAAQAEALLNSTLLQEAFQFVKDEIFTHWKGCNKSEERDRLWQAINITERVEKILAQHILNGRVAKVVLDDLQKNRSRKAA